MKVMGLVAAARMQRSLTTLSARSLLRLLIALSMGIFVFEAVHVTWGSQAMRGVRRRMDARLFHVSGSESTVFKQEEVASSELLHVSLLQEVCVNSGDVIIPWQYGRPRSHGPQDTAEDRKLLLQRNDPWLLQVSRTFGRRRLSARGTALAWLLRGWRGVHKCTRAFLHSLFS